MVFDDCYSFVSGYFNNTAMSMKNESHFLDANDNQWMQTNTAIRRKTISPRRNNNIVLDTIGEEDEELEPPLLEELEIYPKQIQEKAMTMLNPFFTNELANEKFLADCDLFGPIFFCFLFGSCLFLAGKVFIFSHLYSIAMVSVLGMYGLLKLMCYGYHQHYITIKGVASALGYGMLHMVWFSFIGIFIRLSTVEPLCFVFGVPAVLLATLGASRLLGRMLHQTNNTLLIAYPTAMIYILFSFLIIF